MGGARSKDGLEALKERLLAGDTRALARAISLVEGGGEAGRQMTQLTFTHAGSAFVVGVTGIPGAGKSTLVDGLATLYRKADERVGVVAVDPSSAFSGGALLGDRIRMQRHTSDPGVFIRSMATRQHLGGLAVATPAVVDLIDAAGHQRILIETVGVGQDEIEVIEMADTVVVAMVPGLGDDVQAIKAGILEVADIFVINKSDREGADRLHQELENLRGLVEHPKGEWVSPIVRTVATTGEGIEELRAAIEQHAADPRNRPRRQERLRRAWARRLRELIDEGLWSRLLEAMPLAQEMDGLVAEIAGRRRDPFSVAESILRRVRLKAGK
ncbi:MAG: methylmalonyl Co-A mutase-associated GTPase MeaB [Acidobacteriota bacterium]